MICVLTTEGVLFEIQGTSWVSERLRVDNALQTHVKVCSGQGSVREAEFSDVHAVWYKDKGEIVSEDGDN